MIRKHDIADMINGTDGIFTSEEIRQLSMALSKLLTRYQSALRMAKNSPSAISNIPSHDPIGQEILAIASVLQDARKSTDELTKAFESEKSKFLEQDWIKSKYSEIFDSIQGLDTTDKLGTMLASKLATALNAQQIAILTSDTEAGTPILRQVAGFGIHTSRESPTIRLGEGLLGQACADKTTKYLEKIPGEYLRIKSALGSAPVRTVALVPFIADGTLVGAAEIASIYKFSDAHKTLINLVSGGIGINIKSITAAAANQKLLEEIAKTNASLDSQKKALDASAIVAETDPRGVITYVNDKFLEISKYSREELLGQDHRILNSGYHPKDFFTGLWRNISRGQIWKAEVKNRAKDGSYYWVDTTVFPIKDEKGKIEKHVAIRFDITSRKIAEDGLKAATASAENMAAAKVQFLANISHEIRSPLNGIIGFAQLLEGDNLSLEQQRSIQTIRNCSDHLLTLINDFLDFSKMEAGKLETEQRTFDVIRLIDESGFVASDAISLKGLKFETKVSPKVPRYIVSDPTRIRQVLINLISNAAKFTMAGHIHVSVDVEDSTTQSTRLKFSVKDTGIGISQENAQKLFQAFSQADSSTTRKFGGTGLGLAICKKIVEALQGKIWVESTEGQGSTFFFTINAGIGAAMDIEQISGTNQAVRDLKLDHLEILIAEDNQVNQTLIVNLMKKLGQDVTVVSNGRDAVDACKSGKIDIILMDVQMPVMNGIDASREIFSTMNSSDWPEIIALTANTSPEDKIACLNAGMSGFVPKPFRIKTLADELSAAALRLSKRRKTA
jgi:PAS domain S-box-containing protein